MKAYQGMKKLVVIGISILALSGCGEERSPLEQIVELRCDCLEKFDAEQDNLIEVLSCSDEINSRPEFANLDQTEIMKAMEEKCPDAALPFDQLVQ